jgi:hypothetical protein
MSYTAAEEEMLGLPFQLEPDFAICDRAGCSSMARWLIPGAALCDPCAEELGALGDGDEDGLFRVPVRELTGDDRWRRARTDEYAERVRRHPLLARSDRSDRALEALAAAHVETLLRGV